MMPVRERSRLIHLIRIIAVLPLMVLPHAVSANEGMPELLQFAMKYRNEKKETTTTRPPDHRGSQPNTIQVTTPQVCKQQSNEYVLRLKQSELQLNQQQATLQAQEKQLLELRQALDNAVQTPTVAHTESRMPVDYSTTWQLLRKFKHLWGELLPSPVTIDSQVQVEAQTQEKSRCDLSPLNMLIDRLKLENETQNQTLEQKEATLDALQKQVEEADSRQIKQDLEVTSLRDEIKGLRDKALLLAKPESLIRSKDQQDYAAGSALGRNVIEMLEERENWGVKTDRQRVLTGIIDAFSGHYQLPEEVMTQALADSEAEVTKARNNTGSTQQKSGEAFIADFKNQEGVQHSTTGFWYRVDYAGDTQIAEDAIIEVVVKESLTDGTLIHDMALDNKVLSQPLKQYPPLFREAIGHLRNHGILTMVVPPELAYGETGYPPKVPPDATMVYELRIDNVR